MRQTTALVYVMVSFNGRQLYAGQTSNLEQRWSLHRLRSPWLPYVYEIHTTPMKPLAETRTEERQWIEEFRPLFNRMYNADYEELGKTARAALYEERLADLDRAWHEIPPEVVAAKWAQISANRAAAGLAMTPMYGHNLYPVAA